MTEEIVDLNAKREALRDQRAIAELDADDARWWAVRDAVAAAMLSSPLSAGGMMTAVVRALLDVLQDRGASFDQACTLIENHLKGFRKIAEIEGWV